MMHTRNMFWGALLVAAAVTVGCRQDRDVPDRAGAGGPDTGTSTEELVGDTWITTKVQAQFFTSPDVKGGRIDVTTEDGVVTLQGRVPSEGARERAVAIARDTDGVVRVNDQLQVEMAQGGTPPTGTAGETAESGRKAIDDDVIETRVMARFYGSDELRAQTIDVSASDGVVTLSGTVPGEAQHLQAVQLARETQGVRRVEDKLEIGEGQRPAGETDPVPVVTPAEQAGEKAVQVLDDGWITTKITSQYFLDDIVKATRIDVTTENGIVTLTGTVGTEEARQRALQIARQTDGVKDVVDQLKVEDQ